MHLLLAARQCGVIDLVVPVKIKKSLVKSISGLWVNGISSLRPVDRNKQDRLVHLLCLDLMRTKLILCLQ